MKALLYKQLKLTAHPMTFLFLGCGAMLLIPNYPYTVAFFYITLGLFFMYLNGREQRDEKYTALLPVRKKDAVRCGIIFSAGIELMSLLSAAAFILVGNAIYPERTNLAAIDANAASLGMGFLAFSVFNLVFFISFYKTGYKVGLSFFKASSAVFAVVAADVALPFFIPWLDGRDVKQYFFLAACAVIYALATFSALRISEKNYEKVDL